jgi:hypothetical protein
MGDRSGRYTALTQRLVDAVLAAPGYTPTELRRAALARAARLGGRREPRERPDGVPAPLAGYVDQVALGAYRVSDADLDALQDAGSSQDAIFEITVAAALGAALGRLERGLAALRGEEPD